MQRFILSLMLASALLALISMIFISPNQPLETSAPLTVEVSKIPTKSTVPLNKLQATDVVANPETTHYPTAKKPDKSTAPQLPDLGSVAARQSYYEQQLGKAPAELWQAFQALQAEPSKNTIMARQLIAMALPLRLREMPDNEVYQALQALLALPETTPYGQVSQIAQILGQSATSPALTALIEQALSMDAKQETRIAILQAIERSTRLHWNAQTHNADLSPPLERAWQQVQNSKDIALLNTLGTSLAEVGTEQGIQQLLNTLEPVNHWTVKQLQIQKKVAAVAALQAFENIRNPSALPLLAETLFQAPKQSLSQQAAERVLVEMAAHGNTLAKQTLEIWHQQVLPE
ncbi:hypothetical protein [Candidatus Venteria ishoeyi]|uniref:HEAT repeat protein n=1 Tax=Candidatus Venteria ishoeyi TaxID=1899563 RepID=A0A1H6FFI3_9GAMM|nr:hypothetical protein [Candidatus Venteria ishoeyi]SEH08830.1 Uncharacterised protein [Candidatus Venteria ishoeyi]